jgi:hypothetical protein
MSNKSNKMDARSLRGIFSRGKASYPSGSPNPAGFNGNLKAAARAKLASKRKKLV